MGPAFAEAARRRLRAGVPDDREDARTRFVRLASGVRDALSSRPALVGYGAVAGLAAAAALLFLTGLVAGRVVELARPPGWSRTWTVGPGDDRDFATIWQALQRAQPGDIVEVEPGSYELPLVVPRDIRLVSRRSREAVLRPPADTAQRSPGVRVMGGSRFAGFKIDAVGGVVVSVGDQGSDEAVLEDLEITGASAPAVVFGRGSRGVLRASYLHDNSQVAVLVVAGARPSLLHNLITANGKRQAGAARALDEDEKTGPMPAVVVQDGASPALFGNLIAGNADDQVSGLLPDKRADVLRDNVVGLPPPARAVAPAKPSAPGVPRRR
jgi:hypothetical protein